MKTAFFVLAMSFFVHAPVNAQISDLPTEGKQILCQGDASALIDISKKSFYFVGLRTTVKKFKEVTKGKKYEVSGTVEGYKFQSKITGTSLFNGEDRKLAEIYESFYGTPVIGKLVVKVAGDDKEILEYCSEFALR